MIIWLLILNIQVINYGVFGLNIYYTKCIPRKSPNHVRIDKTDNDEDFLFLSLDDVDGHIEGNNGIKYLVFTPTEKNIETLKIRKHFGKKLKDKLK